MTPFQITKQDLEYIPSLEPTDVGLWALVIQGCIQLFDTQADAQQCALHIQNGE